MELPVDIWGCRKCVKLFAVEKDSDVFVCPNCKNDDVNELYYGGYGSIKDIVENG